MPLRASQGPQPIYAAFSLIKQGKLRTQRCGPYTITYGTYAGRTASPDARLAGVVTYTSRIAALRGGATGVARGRLVIRDGNRRRRANAYVTGVLTQGSVVNGIVTGSITSPNARLLANLTMVFDDRLSFAAVRLGLESGANTGIAYPAIPRCR